MTLQITPLRARELGDLASEVTSPAAPSLSGMAAYLALDHEFREACWCYLIALFHNCHTKRKYVRLLGADVLKLREERRVLALALLGIVP